MIKKYIIVIIAILFAVWIGFFFGKKSAVAPEAPLSGETEQATTPAASTVTTKVPSTPTATKPTVIAPAMTKDGSYIVSYTSHGFTPQTLTVSKGKSVHFVNNSDKAMSITSTDMNSQIYSELNQSATVGRGGSYDFTFLTAGTWAYMNRNNQTDRAMVIVK